MKDVVVFLEQHNYDFSLGELADIELEGVDRACVLIEERPYSIAFSCLEDYLINGHNKKEILKKASGSRWFWKEKFKREMDLIDSALDNCKEIMLEAIDCRTSPKSLENFFKDDELLGRKIGFKGFDKMDFFQEHAFMAWYVKKKIYDIEADKFLLTVGALHFPSLHAYIPNLKFIKLPFQDDEREEIFDVKGYEKLLENLDIQDVRELFNFFLEFS